jgi:hypothetical protein
LRADAHEKKKRRKCQIKFHGRVCTAHWRCVDGRSSLRRPFHTWVGVVPRVDRALREATTSNKVQRGSHIRKSTKKTARVEPEKHPRVQCGTGGENRRDRDERKKSHGERGLSSGDIGREAALGRKGRRVDVKHLHERGMRGVTNPADAVNPPFPMESFARLGADEERPRKSRRGERKRACTMEENPLNG